METCESAPPDRTLEVYTSLPAVPHVAEIELEDGVGHSTYRPTRADAVASRERSHAVETKSALHLRDDAACSFGRNVEPTRVVEPRLRIAHAPIAQRVLVGRAGTLARQEFRNT